MARWLALAFAIVLAALPASCGGTARDQGGDDICVVVFGDTFVIDQGCTCGLDCSTGEYGCEATLNPDCSAADMVGMCPNEVKTYREVDGNPCSSPRP